MSKPQWLIYLNSPSHIEYKDDEKGVKNVELTGRVWMDIFKDEIRVGDLVVWDRLNWVVEYISKGVFSHGRLMADVKVSRTFDINEILSVSHESATKLYIKKQKEEYAILHPEPEVRPPDPKTIAPYLLYMFCNDHTRCKAKVVLINEKTEKKAKKIAKKVIADNGGTKRIISSTLFKISDRVNVVGVDLDMEVEQ